jgi:hypothetical protein
MTKELRHQEYGRTVSDWIGLTAGELVRDAVGLWQIVPDGRTGFGLGGPDLVDFVRKSVLVLLKRGAKPVRGGRGTGYNWIVQPQYGTTDADIADAVIAEWLAAGRDPDFDGVWFALPHVYQEKAAVRF